MADEPEMLTSKPKWPFKYYARYQVFKPYCHASYGFTSLVDEARAMWPSASEWIVPGTMDPERL